MTVSYCQIENFDFISKINIGKSSSLWLKTNFFQSTLQHKSGAWYAWNKSIHSLMPNLIDNTVTPIIKCHSAGSNFKPASHYLGDNSMNKPLKVKRVPKSYKMPNLEKSNLKALGTSSMMTLLPMLTPEGSNHRGIYPYGSNQNQSKSKSTVRRARKSLGLDPSIKKAIKNQKKLFASYFLPRLWRW